MALHFGGYEFARASNLAMFTSKETGFGSRAAFPLAMALVTPLSLLLLGGYNNQLQEHGPRLALRHTTLFSIFVIGISTVLFQIVNRLGPQRFPYGKWIVGMAFIFQNSYAHLLYTQQWSFLGSIMFCPRRVHLGFRPSRDCLASHRIDTHGQSWFHGPASMAYWLVLSLH